MQNKWYHSSWFIILMLIFFFPVGLFLMWFFKKWNIVGRIIITAVIAIMAVSSIFIPTTTNEPQQTAAQKPKEETKHVAKTEKTEKKESESSKIKKAIKKEMNMGEVETVGYHDGNVNILITTDNISNNMNKKEIQHIMADTLIGLKKSGIKIESANIGVKIGGQRAASSEWNRQAIQNSEQNKTAIYKNPHTYAESYQSKY